MFNSTRSFEIRSDTDATITPDPLDSPRKAVSYTGSCHLVQFDPRFKTKTVGQTFTMRVRMEFRTQTAPSQRQRADCA